MPRPTAPHDRGAERAVLGASLHHHELHTATRTILEPRDFWYPQHQAIYAACDHLDDIGPFPFGTWEEWAPLHPQTPPSRLAARTAAAWTIVDNIPLWVLHRLPHCADGRHLTSAATIKAKAAERDELVALKNRIIELAGA